MMLILRSDGILKLWFQSHGLGRVLAQILDPTLVAIEANTLGHGTKQQSADACCARGHGTIEFVQGAMETPGALRRSRGS